MCGIAAAVLPDSVAFLREALCRLEYRGYDSWGVALRAGSAAEAHRQLGPPSRGAWPDGKYAAGVAHTRWATHGPVDLKNTHPVRGEAAGRAFYLVHNGVVENHRELRDRLESRGHTFVTDTDTECLARLYAEYRKVLLPDRALDAVLREAQGHYAVALLCDDWVLGACRGLPLYLAEGSGGRMLASDPAALAGFATHAARVPDDHVVILHERASYWTRPSTRPVRPDELTEAVPDRPADVTGRQTALEIAEQPRLVRELASPPDWQLPYGHQVVLYGCGSSYNAALFGRRVLEQAGVVASAEYATELCPEKLPHGFAVAITQSGETADTLAAMRRFRCQQRVLTNVATSSAARLARPVLLGCGPERGVAATKTFTASCLMLAAAVGRNWLFGRPLSGLADAMQEVLASGLTEFAAAAAPYRNVLVLGRQAYYPVAREIALKMSEVALRHAQAMPASEIKHGPIALADGSLLAVVLADREDPFLPQIAANASQIQARGARVLGIGDAQALAALGVTGFETPWLPGSPFLRALLANMVGQLLAVSLAEADGLDPDRPRNLAKSVTV